MSTWADLLDEAARWSQAGRTAALWWRDDDAADVGPALERLLAIHRDTGAPLALAVVPATATQALADRLAGEPAFDLLQHGYAHVNHAAPGDNKKIELGHRAAGHAGAGRAGHRPHGARTAVRRAALAGAGAALEPHRAGLVPTLPEIGFAGLSTFGARRAHASGERASGGQHSRRLDRLEGRPRFCRRGGRAGCACCRFGRARISGEPVGVLSHHLAMDGGAWDFLRSIWQKALKMPGLRIRPAHELFATGGGRG
jgi:hypothetical protein